MIQSLGIPFIIISWAVTTCQTLQFFEFHNFVFTIPHTDQHYYYHFTKQETDTYWRQVSFPGEPAHKEEIQNLYPFLLTLKFAHLAMKPDCILIYSTQHREAIRERKFPFVWGIGAGLAEIQLGDYSKTSVPLCH